MTLKKRGLSRGLEALLKPDSTEKIQPVQKKRSSVDDMKKDPGQLGSKDLTGPRGVEISGNLFPESLSQAELISALFEHIRKENLMLLEEAEALRQMIEEFEQIVRRL
ncbi:MAG: hypothetical protein ACU83N_14480 [Gammaproteobacteria bacterium]